MRGRADLRPGRLRQPDGGGTVTTAGISPGHLFGAGFGAVLAFTIASFTGFESGAIYSEEVKDPRRTVARATYIAVAFTGLFYAFSAWALTAHRSENAPAASAEAGPGIIFGALDQYTGAVVADIANVLFITSVLAALLSFHNGVARYLFALGRERVLPGFLGATSSRSGAPSRGSLVQSVLAVVVFLAFAMTGRDPVIDLFTWLSGAAAGRRRAADDAHLGLRGGLLPGPPRPGNAWQRAIAPALGTVLLTAVLLVLLFNFDALLAPTPRAT
ncbi:APC family permease [Micromonospora sp. BRA006-A]|nr:APC family permease [Micromonospora sp. BRA006-A]